MRDKYNYNSMPLLLAGAAIGFLLLAIGSGTANASLLDGGVLLAALATPIALAYLHFIVLTDSPWWLTWGGLVLGGIGSGLFLMGSGAPIAPVLASAGYTLIGVAFIVNPNKPTPPGVFFVLGGALIVIHAVVFAQQWVAVAGYGCMAITFGFGAGASLKQAVSGEAGA